MKLFTILSACLLLSACHTTGTTAPKQCSEKAHGAAHSCSCQKCDCCNKG